MFTVKNVPEDSFRADPNAQLEPSRVSTNPESDPYTHAQAHDEFSKLHEDFSTLESSTTHYMTEWWGGAYKEIYGRMEEIRNDLEAARKDPSGWAETHLKIRDGLSSARSSYQKAKSRLEERSEE